jgi:hypothetical protein
LIEMQARALTIRLVRLAMAASLIVPRLLFAFASWNNYRNLKALTDERLTRSLDVQREEAQKTFELVGLAARWRPSCGSRRCAAKAIRSVSARF